MQKRPIIPLRPAASPAPLPRNGKRFHVWTIGCQMNEADSAKIAATLQEAGYRPPLTSKTPTSSSSIRASCARPPRTRSPASSTRCSASSASGPTSRSF